MKLVTPHTPTRSDDDNLIPLINVVFLMLIFFMVAGQIRPSDAVRVAPPLSVSETPLAQEPLTLVVDGAGAVYLEGQPLELESLPDQLGAALARAAEPETFSVVIKSDAALPVTRLQAILQQVRASGLLRVSLLTQRTGGNPP